MVVSDTDLTEDAGKSSASRQTFVSGRAAQMAGADLRAKMLALANAGADAAIRLDGGELGIIDRDGVEHAIALGRLPVIEGDDIVLEGRGYFDPPSTPLDENGQGTPYATYGFAAQVASVEVDLELGTVTPLRIVAAHDVGAAVNPTLVEGQIEGGIAQGIGLALMEEYVPGRTENLHDYLFPTIGDVPEIECLLVEDPEPLGPYGAKGIGEPALIPTAPAILNAVYHAAGDAPAPAADPSASGARSARRGRPSWLRVRTLAEPTAPTSSAPARNPGSCAATPVPILCRIKPGKLGACDRYANENGVLVRTDPLVLTQRALEAGAPVVPFAGEGLEDWDGRAFTSDRTFVTGIGSGTTYPDYKPAPFIVAAEYEGVDTVTVVSEGIFSYCGVKVKIDTDRYLGPECATIRVEGEPVGHVTTAEYGSQMLAIGGVNQLTGGTRRAGRITCETLLALCNREAVELAIDGGSTVVTQAGRAPVVNGVEEQRMRAGCGSATVGMFAQQWHGHVDEVIVVDDHITGVLTEHQAGVCLDMPRAGIRVRGRKSTPGRYFQVANPGTGWGGTDITEPLTMIRSIDPKVAWPGMRVLLTTTTGEDSLWCILDEDRQTLRPAPIPEPVRVVVDRIGENCEPSLCSVLFMAGSGRLAAGRGHREPHPADRLHQVRGHAGHHGRGAGLDLAGGRHHGSRRRHAAPRQRVRIRADARHRRAHRVHRAGRRSRPSAGTSSSRRFTVPGRGESPTTRRWSRPGPGTSTTRSPRLSEVLVETGGEAEVRGWDAENPWPWKPVGRR